MGIIRLMLVDDHDVVRTGLKSFLQTQNGLEVIAEANSGELAVQLVQSEKPDVIVMDIAMPEMDGLEATRRIKACCPESRVLALTVHADQQYFFEMLAAGADGYVTKQVAAEELVEAIRSVAAGHVYLQPALASWLLQDYRRLLLQAPTLAEKKVEDAARQDGLAALSRRELQVLECVAQGMTSVEIGEALEISPKTVSRHRERIMGKLNMHSSAELVRFAIRTGLIDAG
jgi:two-component system, NarL family, response regulator NreC